MSFAPRATGRQKPIAGFNRSKKNWKLVETGRMSLFLPLFPFLRGDVFSRDVVVGVSSKFSSLCPFSKLSGMDIGRKQSVSKC